MQKDCQDFLKRSGLIAIAVAMATIAMAAPPAERAAPPTWSDADLEPFFPDAREALVGERPAATTSVVNAEPADAAAAKIEWSRLVDADALATEVKRIAARLVDSLESPTAYRSGGYHQCRLALGDLAVVMAVIDQYDGDVRWIEDAAEMRDEASRVAKLCRVGGAAEYPEAVRVRDQLNELIRGERLAGDPRPEFESWSSLVHHPLLMARLERLMRDEVDQRLSNADAFARSAADVRHGAMMAAVLAEVIHQPAYDFWDDATYVEYAKELQAHALELSAAAADGDYESARGAAGEMRNTCAKCHDGYNE